MVAPRIFSPGQTCGNYTILSLYARSPVAESYVARHKQTRDEAILTCSRLEHFDSASPQRSRFFANAALLRATKVEGAPDILDAGLSNGVYWVAREHFDDAIPVWEVFSGNKGSRIFGGWKELLERAPHLACSVLALLVGTEVANILRAFAAKGISHGALDPTRTIVVLETGDIAVLETGYHALFGLEHFPCPEDLQMLQAPERALGNAPDSRSDIYTLGVVLARVLALATTLGEHAPSREVAAFTLRMARQSPEDRVQRWQQVHSTLSAIFDVYKARMERLGAAKSAEQPAGAGDPQSGVRDRASGDASDIDRDARPAQAETDAQAAPPETARCRESSAPTPRSPEISASVEAQVIATTGPGDVVDPADGDERAIATAPARRIGARRTRSRRRRLPLKTGGSPALQASVGAARLRSHWITKLSIAANVISMAVVVLLFMKPAPPSVAANPALQAVSVLGRYLSQPNEPPRPLPLPAPSGPPAQKLEPTPLERQRVVPPSRVCGRANCSEKRSALAFF